MRKGKGCGCRSLSIGTVAALALIAVIAVCGQLAPGGPSTDHATVSPTALPGRVPATGQADHPSAFEPIDLTATARPTIPTSAPATSTGAGQTAVTATPTSNMPTVSTSANLRAGPGTDFPTVGGVAAGQVLTINAKSPAGDWPQLADQTWISAELVSYIPDVRRD